MFNPSDTHQIRAMVDARQEQLAVDAHRARKAQGSRSVNSGGWQRIRFAFGAGLIRVGARIAGTYGHELPHLRPGV